MAAWRDIAFGLGEHLHEQRETEARGDEAKCAGKHLPLELRFPRWEGQSGGGRRAAAGQLTGAWTRVEAGGFGKTRKR
jgi:hypothetical protein